MATAVFVYTEACELEGVVRGIFGAACPLLVQLTHRDRRRPQLDLQRMDSLRSKRSARNIEILPCEPHLHAYKSGATHRVPTYVSVSTYKKPHCAASARSHTIPRAALHPKPHNQRPEHITDTPGQAPRAASPSGKKSLRATSPTQTPRTTAARRNACPCLRTTTSACTTRRRYVPNLPPLPEQRPFPQPGFF